LALCAFAFHRDIGQACNEQAWLGVGPGSMRGCSAGRSIGRSPTGYSMISTADFQRGSIFGHSRRATYRIATLIWAAALLIASLQPRRPPHFHFSLAHHIAHFLGFGALAFLATVGFGKPTRISLWPAAAAFLFGFAIEFLQHLENRGPIEWHDVRDNAIGIVVLTLLSHMVYRRTHDAKKGQLPVTELV
jgi:hypothetical protein